MKLELYAHGKINLGLDVIGERPDGYHEVKMIMQTVEVCDRLEFEDIDEDEIQLKSDAAFLPLDGDNLICKACRLMKDEYDIKKGVRISLEKHIPVAAGMAGGSADAAAALVAMNEIFALGLSRDRLMELGVKLGADVPYCIMKGTALSEGIGEKLTELAPMPDCYILIAKPGVSVSTKEAYGGLVLDEHTLHPDIDGMVEAIKAGDLKGVTDRMGNVLEPVTAGKHEEIDILEAAMKDRGALNAMMTGSGPTVFGIYDDKAKAMDTVRHIKENDQAKQIFLVKPYNV